MFVRKKEAISTNLFVLTHDWLITSNPLCWFVLESRVHANHNEIFLGEIPSTALCYK